MVIKSGLVGIGTTAPSSSLDVIGAGVKSIRVQSSDNYAYLDIDGGRASDKSWLLGSGISNQGDFEIRENSNATFLTIKPTTGYVGIGTTVPSSTLHVVGSTQTTGQFKAAAGDVSAPSYSFTADTNTGFLGGSDTINFVTGGATRISLNNSALFGDSGGPWVNLGTSASSTPTYTWRDNTTTGIFNPGSHVLGLFIETNTLTRP